MKQTNQKNQWHEIDSCQVPASQDVNDSLGASKDLQDSEMKYRRLFDSPNLDSLKSEFVLMMISFSFR